MVNSWKCTYTESISQSWHVYEYISWHTVKSKIFLSIRCFHHFDRYIFSYLSRSPRFWNFNLSGDTKQINILNIRGINMTKRESTDEYYKKHSIEVNRCQYCFTANLIKSASKLIFPLFLLIHIVHICIYVYIFFSFLYTSVCRCRDSRVTSDSSTSVSREYRISNFHAIWYVHSTFQDTIEARAKLHNCNFTCTLLVRLRDTINHEKFENWRYFSPFLLLSAIKSLFLTILSFGDI